MTGRGLGRWARGLAVGSIACAAWPIAPFPASADTLEGAWRRRTRTIRRSIRSAPWCAPPMRPFRRRCRAIARGYRDCLGRQTILGHDHRRLVGSLAGRGRLSAAIAAPCAVRLRRDRDADALQRLPDRQQNAPGREPGAGRARDLAHDRADGAAQRGDGLYELAARRRDPRSAAAQRRGVAGAIAADARPLQCRRSDAHGRRAVGIAAGAGRSQVLSAEANYKASVATYRQVIGVEPGKLTPGSPVDRFSPATADGDRGRDRDPSDGDQRAIQCRRRAIAGEGRGRRALSDAVVAGQRAAELCDAA